MKLTKAQLDVLKKTHLAPHPHQILRSEVGEEMWLDLHEGGWIIGAFGSTDIAVLTPFGRAALESAESEE
jgi:hypothetical protein